jgi:transglutaminase-like putative cysteine protease
MKVAGPLPDRYTAHWLLASVLLVLAPHAAYQPLWLSLGVLALLAWRALLTQRAWPVPGRVLRTALTLLMTLLVYHHYGTLFGRDPGVALMCGMLALKLLELRSQRDYLLAAFLLYFLILASFLYSQSLWLAAYLLGAVLLCTATLVRLAQPGAEARYALGLAGRLLLQALPLMLVMYLLFPRIQGSLWGLPVDAHSGLTGMSDELRPGSINQLSQSDAVAFRAAFSGAPPANADLYWRSLVLWQTDGRIWSRGGQSIAAQGGFQGTGSPVDYVITFEASNKPWLVALDLPATLPANLRLRPGFVLAAAAPVRERLRYALTSWPRYRTGELSVRERAAALQLPADIGERTRALAMQWRAQSADDADVVQAALRYFRNENFTYTLQPPLLGRQPVEEFLFDVRRGYCEHYAAALVTLMRAAGIPARALAGYQGGEFNPSGNYLIVRQSDAHAWAEVWLAQRGWVRVDPTAAVAPERIEYGADAVRRLARQGAAFGQLEAEAVRRALSLGWLENLARQGNHLWDAVDSLWNAWVLDYSVERQQQLLRRLGFDTPSPRLMVKLLAGLCALLLLAYAVYGWRAPVRDPVLRAYQKFCRKLARAGLVRAAHEGAQDFAQRCAQQRPDVAGDIARITQHYVRLRYGAPANRLERQLFARAVAAFRVSR